VLWKIARDRGFLWLLRRHLLTVAVAVYLYSVIPVDAFVVQYNVQRIRAGDSAPSVQISVHPISSEGVLCLQPLLECDDPIVQEGVRAYLAEAMHLVEARETARCATDWTSYQMADELLLQQLRRVAASLAPYQDAARRREALQRFHEYAYQWY